MVRQKNIIFNKFILKINAGGDVGFECATLQQVVVGSLIQGKHRRKFRGSGGMVYTKVLKTFGLQALRVRISPSPLK